MTKFGTESESKRRKWYMTQGTEKSKKSSERPRVSTTGICKSEGTISVEEVRNSGLF
jgi:hypothetical protein